MPHKSSVLFTVCLLTFLLVGCTKDNKTAKEQEGTNADHEIGSADDQMDIYSIITIPQLTIDSCVIPDNEAMRFVADMKIGWNLGNTFDAHSKEGLFDELSYETAWCGVKTSKEMIEEVKKAGFQTVRIPVSWHNHTTGDSFEINEEWMKRVKEVIDYVISEDMYAIINIHHDVSVKYYYPSKEHLTTSIHYMTSVWKQISEAFKDYDEHVIFEAINEPRLAGTEYEWSLDYDSDIGIEVVEIVNQLNQVFVNTVRSAGGNNVTRYLMVPGYDASPYATLRDEFQLPTDIASNDHKIMVSIHAYTPYRFALLGSEETESVSNWSISEEHTKEIDYIMIQMYDKYISQGIPVVIGEFGANDKNNNLQDRVDFAAYFIRAARARGITCCWWDNNTFVGSGGNFGLLQRDTLTWEHTAILEAIMKYAE